jgi:hypothetical protein
MSDATTTTTIDPTEIRTGAATLADDMRAVIPVLDALANEYRDLQVSGHRLEEIIGAVGGHDDELWSQLGMAELDRLGSVLGLADEWHEINGPSERLEGADDRL